MTPGKCACGTCDSLQIRKYTRRATAACPSSSAIPRCAAGNFPRACGGSAPQSRPARFLHSDAARPTWVAPLHQHPTSSQLRCGQLRRVAHPGPSSRRPRPGWCGAGTVDVEGLVAGNLSSDDPRWDEGGLGRPHGGARNGGGAANGGPSFQDVSLDGSSSISKVLAHANAHISAHAQPRLLAHVFSGRAAV